jgi:hypothetical protein
VVWLTGGSFKRNSINIMPRYGRIVKHYAIQLGWVYLLSIILKKYKMGVFMVILGEIEVVPKLG